MFTRKYRPVPSRNPGVLQAARRRRITTAAQATPILKAIKTEVSERRGTAKPELDHQWYHVNRPPSATVGHELKKTAYRDEGSLVARSTREETSYGNEDSTHQHEGWRWQVDPHGQSGVAFRGVSSLEQKKSLLLTWTRNSTPVSIFWVSSLDDLDPSPQTATRPRRPPPDHLNEPGVRCPGVPGRGLSRTDSSGTGRDRLVGHPGSCPGALQRLMNCHWVRLFFVGGPTSLCGGGEAGGSWIRQRVGRGEEAAKGTGVRRYLCRQRPLGVFRWYSRASWKVSVRIKAPAARGGLRTASRGRHADRPFDEPATSTARRIAAATWMMSSTTVASRAYAVVPARRSRWSRGASRTSSAPAAGSARHRADAGRGAARSPDAQPASCRRSFPCDFRARTAPSTRHRWRPRPDRQSLPGCVGRDVLARACVPTPAPAGAVPVRVRSRSSVGLRWRRGRLWHPRKQHRPPRPGDRCGGRRFAALARRLYVLGILSPQPSQVPLPKTPYQNAARMSSRERA